MRCVITDTGKTLDCQCGRKWPKLPPAGAPQDCFPMLAARLQEAERLLRDWLSWDAMDDGGPSPIADTEEWLAPNASGVQRG